MDDDISTDIIVQFAICYICNYIWQWKVVHDILYIIIVLHFLAIKSTFSVNWYIVAVLLYQRISKVNMLCKMKKLAKLQNQCNVKSKQLDLALEFPEKKPPKKSSSTFNLNYLTLMTRGCSDEPPKTFTLSWSLSRQSNKFWNRLTLKIFQEWKENGWLPTGLLAVITD